MIKLNIGGATNTPIDGYEIYDIKNGQDAHKLPYDDNSVDEIRASHILEHFSHRETESVLKEWVRCLKPGGRMKLAVPDFQYLASRFLQGIPDIYDGYIFGGHSDENDYHKTLFDRRKLLTCMQQAGLCQIQDWRSEDKDCSSLDCSLNLEGIKGEEVHRETIRLPNIKAVISMPRLAMTENMFAVFGATAPLGIDVLKSDGVFWGQCLTDLFQKAINMGAEYILTIDYDSVFKSEDIVTLYNLMIKYPYIDALCPIQTRRESQYTLLTKQGKDGSLQTQIDLSEFAKDVMPIATGHFGLSLIRVSRLKQLSKPWFLHHPNKDNEWGDGKVDEDIHFWSQWHEAGFKVYAANHVPIGHIQQMIMWPDNCLQPIAQFISVYQKEGKPEMVLK